ncbi:MAG TPA: bifunctional [glutamine synthetase] adenylyltransferase/[glutamine synthetase]-adenylyl-L-tyrosine phosphorylase [Devosiaceae bacterium]
MSLADELKPLPGGQSDRAFEEWRATLDGNQAVDRASPLLGPLFARAPYLAELAGREADWFAGALGGDADAALAQELAAVNDAGRSAASEEELEVVLRRAKARVALLAGVAEVGQVWTTRRACEALSDLADAALEAGLDYLAREAAGKGSILMSPDEALAANCGLVIFALGKHGGRELNYSSDIDVVAFYDPDKGILADPLEANKLYSRMVRHLVSLMQDRTADGYVFRTDLRLRPDPGSTPVALSFDAAMTYYEARGQNWERAAWIKARPCAGDRGVGEAFLKEMAPFVWRKHLDFATIADIQAMKRQINIHRNVGDERVAGHNVKLGRGGIREIEFFTQTQQLIAGGRDPGLRVRPTTSALEALAAAGWITPRTSSTLVREYWFLRAIENRLQMLRDEQTHVMPEDDEGVQGIACLMGEPDVETFGRRYRDALATVVSYYSELFTEGATLATTTGNLVFTGSDDDPGTIETLANLGFAEPEKASATVRKWHYGGYAATRAAVSRAHLTELLPALLEAIAATGNADGALARFDHFLSRLPAGVQLFALLRNHDVLLHMLVAFMASAPRMSELVIHRAHVMDGLIDPAFADDVAQPAVLVEKLDAFLADARGYEDLMDRARIIGQEQMFLVAAGLISGTIGADAAGRAFSAVAETLLGRLFASVREEMARRHGEVPGAEVALLAFGKMASREMTVTSDLDFIMLFEAPAGVEESNGERPLATSHYFTRLTQRLVAALSSPTAQGVLYQTDMRLRPSGNAGPLATSLASFSAYQHKDAWTWEHLALTRARPIYADGEMAARVEAVVSEVVRMPRDREKTVTDVLNMRALMARERKPRHPFDLKLAAGGLVDLEFMAQAAQLLEAEAIAAPQAPPREVLSRLGQIGLLPEGERMAAIHAVYSSILQIMSACLLDPFKDEGWTPAFRELLARLTNYPDFSRLEADIQAMTEEVSTASKAWFEKLRVG